MPAEQDAIVFLCVGDDAIPAVAEGLHGRLPSGTALVHCAGSSPSLPYPTRRTGVLWPVQSVTAGTEPDWANLPLVIQSSHAAFAKTLSDVAACLSQATPTLVDADVDRQALHLGACMVQNFGNLLWGLAAEVLADRGLDYRTLLPLGSDHLGKLSAEAPMALQTGPAARGDESTLRRHREALRPYPDAYAAYTELSDIIRRRSGRTLT